MCMCLLCLTCLCCLHGDCMAVGLPLSHSGRTTLSRHVQGCEGLCEAAVDGRCVREGWMDMKSVFSFKVGPSLKLQSCGPYCSTSACGLQQTVSQIVGVAPKHPSALCVTSCHSRCGQSTAAVYSITWSCVRSMLCTRSQGLACATG